MPLRRRGRKRTVVASRNGAVVTLRSQVGASYACSGSLIANWLRLENREVELCLSNPGFDVDLTVETTLPTMVDVWMGDRKVDEGLEKGAIKLEGAPHLARTFPSWLKLSPFAKVEPSQPRAST